ncbi:hypothetical protein DU002_19160 [Corallincola holothuriorum]|uniref:Uncharacterized protein n=1 Tax=Corallincola holothuriorum TaxID=2282215 RepID=A0A368MZX4_9GAMM|nr:hypothetical protein [Corallincola holothuriorum]RCU42875.1 hypothetical protein DU002_19160 [Corallincola holothuriorum]
MARRKELGSIASGIVGSFNSRNNDVDGYWGIGKLYKFVENESHKVVELDLLNGSVEPFTHQFDSLVTCYRGMLELLLNKRAIPCNWLTSAKLIARFEVEYQHKYHYWRSALGKPCEVECSFVDDLGRHHVAFAYNNCRPHEPKLEARSCREGDF